MLKNIKSSYFIKLIFIYITEKQKLKLVKCNKILQKYLDINIINYKYFNGTYIIYKSNGIWNKYFYDGSLIFEGEYLKGKGKEYYTYYTYNGSL